MFVDFGMRKITRTELIKIRIKMDATSCVERNSELQHSILHKSQVNTNVAVAVFIRN